MIFDLDADMIKNAVSQELENVGSQMSEEQFSKVAETIEKGIPGIIATLTRGMHKHWKNQAMEVGTGWGSKYAAAIQYKIEGNTGEIYLDESMIDKGTNKPNIMFAKMVEEGVKSWSIKDALLASNKAKTSSAGIKYIVVPFPVATPRKPSQGKGASQFQGREMTAEAHRIVKAGGRFSGPLKSGQEVSGLTKYVTRQRHEGYGIFICVTENSKGWVHPGVARDPVFPKVIQEIEKRIQEVISAFCQAIVKEYSK